jgi:hypothetical protein
MYKKIWGLIQLRKYGLPCPPFEVINLEEGINSEHVLRKIRALGVPNTSGEFIGITLRPSFPGSLDRLGKHSKLHLMSEEEILKEIFRMYEEYKS